MSVDYIVIGSRIKNKRKEQGKTQEMLAENIGVTVGYISQIERGVTKANLETLSDICIAIKTDLVYLLNGTVIGENNYENNILLKYSKLSDKKKRLFVDFLDVLVESEE